jgi:plasmid maintenance system antidote protein VapI
VSLVEVLKQKQGNKSQRKFAAELGFHQSNLAMIYAGKRRVPPKLAYRMAETWEEIRPLVMEYLMERAA